VITGVLVTEVPDAAAEGIALLREPISPRAAASAAHSIGAVTGLLEPSPAPDDDAGDAAATTAGAAVMTGSLGTSLPDTAGTSTTGTAAEARTAARDEAAGVGAESGRESESAPRTDREVATRDRDGPAVAAFDERAGPASEDASDPVEPADPVVSAKAVGIEAMPAPTPRAKASAPTRPT
jgi:hypothetical protein